MNLSWIDRLEEGKKPKSEREEIWREMFDLISETGSLRNEYITLDPIHLKMLRKGYNFMRDSLRVRMNNLARQGFIEKKKLRIPMKESIWSSKLVAVVRYKRCNGYRRTRKGREFMKEYLPTDRVFSNC